MRSVKVVSKLLVVLLLISITGYLPNKVLYNPQEDILLGVVEEKIYNHGQHLVVVDGSTIRVSKLQYDKVSKGDKIYSKITKED